MTVGSVLSVILQSANKENPKKIIISEYGVGPDTDGGVLVPANKQLTTLMPWRSALNAKTITVERITDTSGAPAETQNNFGFFMLCVPRSPM